MSLPRFLKMTPEQIKRSNPHELASKFEGVIHERNIVLSKSELGGAEYNWALPIGLGLTLGLGLWFVSSNSN